MEIEINALVEVFQVLKLLYLLIVTEWIFLELNIYISILFLSFKIYLAFI